MAGITGPWWHLNGWKSPSVSSSGSLLVYTAAARWQGYHRPRVLAEYLLAFVMSICKVWQVRELPKPRSGFQYRGLHGYVFESEVEGATCWVLKQLAA
jgi:hypothetical protein